VTELTLTQFVPVPFSCVSEYATEFLKDHVQLDVHGGVADTRVATGFRVVDDTSDTTRIHEALLFSWHAKYALLPDLAATLRVRPQDGQGMLFVNAQYSPPLGFVGSLFDRVAGRWIARRSISQMLNDMRRYIVERYEGFRQSLPSESGKAPGGQ